MDDQVPGDESGTRRHPLRRLSSIGGTTTGWRSSLETNPKESFGSFLIGSLVAAGVFAALIFLLMWLGS